MKPTLALTAIIALSLSLSACRYEAPAIGRAGAPTAGAATAPDTAAPQDAREPVAIPPGHPAIPGLGEPGTSLAVPTASLLSGEVLETMDAAGYTYLRVRGKNGEFWAAVRQAELAKGGTVNVMPQMTMTNFESKSLNRKFDSIIFGTLASTAAPSGAMPPMTVPPGGTMPPGHPATGMPPMQGMGMGGGASKVEAGEIKVEKAEGPDGRTVAEIWASKDALGEKQVAVRGKVVKFLPDIMGKNWIHLRDGSGSRDAGNDDITITTTDKAVAGDVVLVTGTVKTGVNLGAGYTYPVLIENARVKK